ncbi:protein-disulfide reductase DsbD [Mesorhizobium sp. B2-1-3A]|uniref:protein-disulfide reductase DsbD n=1 Tax=Mesorhizobium sp. B2-1-3A TaxID=2589971 RepID=UPI00112B8823|nr:protein-disulfide reductase DsbD [Mesorhizobium sp. B2-1-3A]TPM93728.1 protein-disulfide reductase DsbD [Mesorhizobium sp. B2-1-3A]
MPFFLRLLWSLVVLVLLPISAFGEVGFGKAPPRADDVFKLSVLRAANGRLKLHWAIDGGNYLYRDSIEAKLGDETLSLQTPASERKDDPNFGEVEVYHNTLDVAVEAPAAGHLSVTYRGCAEAGICYPPISKDIDLASLAITSDSPSFGGASIAEPAAPSDASTNDDATTALNGGMLTMAAAFLGFGLVLAFTPCVLPMIPILSAMLAGTGTRLTAMRGFALSAAYVTAMAAAYGLVGLAAGLSGANLQVMLQTPWALGISAAVFVALAISMFGVFDLTLPSGLAARISVQRRGGSIAGAAALGFGSALIVSPCVTPPLAAAILYSVQSGDPWRGAIALFFLGLGMGLPLIAFGSLGPRFLPKSGVWLGQVRGAFGFVFLAVAVMLVARLVPDAVAMAMWGVLAIGLGVFIGAFDRMERAGAWSGRLSKSIGLVAALYGAILIVGYAGGGTDPSRPLAYLTSSSSSARSTSTAQDRITSSAEFDRAVARLGEGGKPIFVSFTADWCTVCKSNEAILAGPAVSKRLAGIPVIVADVTAQSGTEQALMKRFGIVGPPTMFVLDARGAEQPGSRLVGRITVEDISKRLTDAGA